MCKFNNDEIARVAEELRRRDERIYELLQKYSESLWIADGFIRDALLYDKPKSIDIFCNSKIVFESAVNEYLDSRMHSLLLRTENTAVYSVKGIPVTFTLNASYDTVEMCVADFDFCISKCAVWFDGGKWVSLVHPNFDRDIKCKILSYEKVSPNINPIDTLWGAMKFASRGYTINKGSFDQIISDLTAGTNDCGDSTKHPTAKAQSRR